MPVLDGICCQVCGRDESLVQCSACTERLRDRGVRISVCSTCLTDERLFEGIAKLLPASSTDGFNFICNICVASNRHAERDRLLRLVGGPSPEELLDTIAGKAPSHLVLKAAAPEELMTALTKVKRKLDYSTTSKELADSLAMRDPLAVVVAAMHKEDNPLTTKTMEAYVAAKAPSIKFKQLLLPPSGNLDRARRHFVELVQSNDKLVAALAAERDFLCQYV